MKHSRTALRISGRWCAAAPSSRRRSSKALEPCTHHDVGAPLQGGFQEVLQKFGNMLSGKFPTRRSEQKCLEGSPPPRVVGRVPGDVQDVPDVSAQTMLKILKDVGFPGPVQLVSQPFRKYPKTDSTLPTSWAKFPDNMFETPCRELFPNLFRTVVDFPEIGPVGGADVVMQATRACSKTRCACSKHLQTSTQLVSTSTATASNCTPLLVAPRPGA